MLVSHRKKFIFTKTLKTAGTSVELYLEPFCLPDGHTIQRTTSGLETEFGIVGARGAPADVQAEKWYNHMPAARIKAQLGEPIWRSYHKFTIVRNPYDKMVSWFHFRHLRKVESQALDDLEVVRRFRDFVRHDDLRVALDRDKYMIDSAICVDRILKYETLAEDLRTLTDDLGLDIEGRTLPRAKAQFRPRNLRYQDYYDEESAATVSSVFQFEIQAFDYRL